MNKLLGTVNIARPTNKLRGPYKPYITLDECTEITISKNHAIDKNSLIDVDIDVYIERACTDGFKVLRLNIPTMRVEFIDGMSDEEVLFFRKFISKRCSDIVDREKELWLCQ